MKFKVGDKVRCIENRDKGQGGAGWEKDYVFTIIDITFDVCWGGLHKNGVFSWALELVTPIKKEIKQYGIVKFLESIEKR